MNEKQISYRIRQILNEGPALDTGKLARLRAAREQALARQGRGAAHPVLGWADNVTGRFGGPGPFAASLFIPMVVLILGLLAINTWHQSQVAQEIEEIDAGLLTGELPLDAYLDKGFDAWLKRSSH